MTSCSNMVWPRCVLWAAVGAVVLATFVDVICLDKEGPPALMPLVLCVSARQNWRRMMSTKDDKDG